MPPTTEIGVGMLGYAFMGRAHSSAYRAIAAIAGPPPLVPRLVAICGRHEQAVAEAARRYGYESHATDWRALVADERIQLFDNGAPNHLHAAPTVAAAESGKHVVCEKPLGRDATESHAMWRRVEAAGVKHMCAFNYRFVPAVRLAREMLEAGDLGEIRHFRGRYLQEWLADPGAGVTWRLDRETAGSGALGDLGAHVIDLARYLVGEITAVSGATRTFVAERPGGHVDVDDAFASVVEFENGAVGTIEASRFCLGRKNALTLEINGSKGSLGFDLERLNELRLHLPGSRPGPGAQGFREVLVSEPEHPFLEHWWPPGHVLGWEHAMVNELHHLLTCIAEDRPVGPHGATFEDGYRAAEVCDAILRSAASRRRESVMLREAAG
ncbi:MAG TPA: Gfo/Idh/MocA family oxidoreductase [Candidatus Dormibacteraeota bacterium]|nr:Gfo/Idh/MocA family oxidoreductase [Candidatus Dormibacteraeota bacterium]